MDRIHTKPSLLTRIVEAQALSTSIPATAAPSRRNDVSFVERYRGTEFESPSPVMVARQPVVSRGRSFVLLLGATVLGLLGMLVATSPG